VNIDAKFHKRMRLQKEEGSIDITG